MKAAYAGIPNNWEAISINRWKTARRSWNISKTISLLQTDKAFVIQVWGLEYIPLSFPHMVDSAKEIMLPLAKADN